MLDINSLLGFQCKTPQRSVVIITGSPGTYGSVATKSKIMSSITLVRGEAITPIIDSIMGTRVVINEEGLYYVEKSDLKNSSIGDFAVLQNPTLSDLTTSPGSVLAPVLQAYGQTVPNEATRITTLIWCRSGDSLWSTDDGSLATGTNYPSVSFKVVKVSS